MYIIGSYGEGTQYTEQKCQFETDSSEINIH